MKPRLVRSNNAATAFGSRAWGVALGLLAASLCAQTPANEPSAKPETIHVLILSGQSDHDWRATTTFLRQTLTGTGRFDVRVCECPAGLTAETLKDFDVLVDDYAGPRWGNSTEQAVQSFLTSGKGLVVVHKALYGFSGAESPWTEFAEMTKVRQATAPAGHSINSPRFLQVDITRPDNPIVAGMKAEFRVADTLCRSLTLSPETEIIATAHDVSENQPGASGQPVLFASNYGAGRVFCTALGHELAGMNERGFITTFLRGTEWAATGKVTLPPDAGSSKPATNAIRALLITGGHEHETAFYTLFDGYKDLGWVLDSSSDIAFQHDLRGKYDLIIMYDFTRDIDQASKRNLRDFLESGKGVLVLHHAILSYQKWPWWYEEVVGGRYLLDHEGDTPASTYKGNREFFVSPAGDHPITAGIAPFHLWDEAYMGMWISPNIKPLLMTDNPDSDPCIAWVGPYQKARVVFIQLGHGHTAFGHPAYRALVHNAILWVAGREIPLN
jgi:type 1 glutamine amidotransferase